IAIEAFCHPYTVTSYYRLVYDYRDLPSFLHDALPISGARRRLGRQRQRHPRHPPWRGLLREELGHRRRRRRGLHLRPGSGRHPRSEEHTSELQSREKLVCRLLLEKKKSIGVTSYKPFK